jgi:hypothetical protein
MTARLPPSDYCRDPVSPSTPGPDFTICPRCGARVRRIVRHARKCPARAGTRGGIAHSTMAVCAWRPGRGRCRLDGPVRTPASDLSPIRKIILDGLPAGRCGKCGASGGRHFSARHVDEADMVFRACAQCLTELEALYPGKLQVKAVPIVVDPRIVRRPKSRPERAGGRKRSNRVWIAWTGQTRKIGSHRS